MWRFLLISCILYRPVTSQHTITAINSSSRGAQWEAHYSHGYDSNSPPSSRDDSTTVKISFKQVSPKFLPGEYRTDLFLNFVLVQEWMDSRLKLNGVETGDLFCTYLPNYSQKPNLFFYRKPNGNEY